MNRFGEFLLLLLFSLSAFAQSTTGTIAGTVKDQSGAVLPGVDMTIVNLATNQTRSAITNERGDYTVPQLQIGLYSVTAALPGFKTEVRPRIELQVDQRARIDFTLEVGEMTERVTVIDEAPLVQSTSASLGSVVDNQKIQQLPLNSRDFEKLALLVPGATPPQPGSSLGFRGGITIGGANERGNNFTLDGISNTTHNVFTYVYKPSVDEIQEFKVQPNAYDAEAGRGEGGQVTVTTKSGSNAFHGTLFEFIRNDKLDARNFFEVRKSPFKRNQFGGNLGGPIRKDKTFFFINYEGLRLRQSETRTATVPTEAMRRGDFSAVSGGIRDPLTGQPFPGNVIPANRLHPIGVRMLNFYPQPNSTGTRNFVSSPGSPDDSNQFTARIDHSFSPNDSAFARYSRYNDHFIDAFNQQSGFSNLPGFARDDTQHNHAATLSYTHLFGPNLLTTAKAGFSRLLQDRRTQDLTNYVPILGIPGLYVIDPGITGIPDIRPTGVEPIGNPSNLPQGRSDLHYQYV
ncbi:MAG: carboxypeptidase regulatory-like domain-containing protein, partial [Acidobacteria bacterium]|nr:carboxypeptidase regulatory-like domain-containing protein [Acidobacteriota bacterium]